MTFINHTRPYSSEPESLHRTGLGRLTLVNAAGFSLPKKKLESLPGIRDIDRKCLNEV